MSDSEDSLWSDVRAGEQGAWDRLVRRYEQLVMSVPRRMGLSEADTEEVAQLTWTTLFRHVESIRKPASLPSWVITTARREAWRLQRARERVGRTEGEHLDASREDPLELPDDAAERLERAQIVREALAALDPRCRRMLALLYVDPSSPSYKEVAEELGLPLGSVGPTRIRCLARLARLLEQRR